MAKVLLMSAVFLFGVQDGPKMPVHRQTAREIREFGHTVPFSPAVVVLATARNEEIDGIGNAVLVDARLGLYLTAAHVVVGRKQVTIVWPGRTYVPARFSYRWVDPIADVAVIQATQLWPTAGVPAFPIANHPPARVR